VANLAILSGVIDSEPKAYDSNSGGHLTMIELKTRNFHTKNKSDWHKIVVFGKLGKWCADNLEKGMHVCVMGPIQRSRWQRGGKWNIRTQIEARSVFLDPHNEATDWLQLAMILAGKQGEPEGEDQVLADDEEETDGG